MDPIVVAGAGIAGIATAFHLTEFGIEDVVLCDPRPPLTLTSDKSTECYRNWWPSAEMVGLMNRSIDLLESYDRRSRGAFSLNRRGYLYLTADQERLDALVADGRTAERHGAGPLRIHTGGADYLPHEMSGVTRIDGADLLDSAALARFFPYVASDAVGGLHARRAGWMSAQQLGAWMLDRAKDRGVRLVAASAERIHTTHGSVRGVELSDGSEIRTSTVVDAAGPLIGSVAARAGVELPVHSEAHFKVSFRDPHRAIARDAPMLIWCDPQDIGWSDGEREALAGIGRADVSGTMPGFCHGRPEGPLESPWFVALWEYHREVVDPHWPMLQDELYPEVVVRGMSRMIPGLAVYRDHLPETFVDGGYYTKAPDNRPIVGPTTVEGFVVAGALSGFGVMAAAAVGELAALHVSGGALPSMATSFALSRFDDPSYLRTLPDDAAGQL